MPSAPESRTCRKLAPSIGTLDGDARATEVSRQRSCSMGFRLALVKLVPMLVDAFTGIGAQGCDEFGRLQVPPLCTDAVMPISRRIISY